MMKINISLLKQNQKKTQMKDLVSINTKIVIIITFHMFKKLEESISILSRDMEDKKVLSRNTRDKNYSSSKEKYTRWDSWQIRHCRTIGKPE